MSVLDLLTPTKKPTERTAILHLARVLYQTHSSGWAPLELTPSYGRPTDNKLSGNVTKCGGIIFETLHPLCKIRILITEGEYNRALTSLNTYYQACIRTYYQRKPNKFDSCPSLNHWEVRQDQRKDIQLQYAAFEALFRALVAPRIQQAI